jgi:hypothetical protein
MVVIHTEIRLNGVWEHLTTKTIKDAANTLWPVLHKYGDTYVRGYSKVTTMDIQFQRPECFVHHFNRASLLKLCDSIGEAEFTSIFGYFPWDSILVFREPDDVNSLVMNNGITDVRAVGWKV